MNRYELTVIIDPNIAEENVPQAMEKLTELVNKNGGVISQTDHWGRRKLAYPIQHHSEGNYVLLKMDLDPSKAAELEANLNISETFLRHLLIRLED
ncbi:MAG: 30S ribosomal protein S6 [Dehalococcoidia bacterium]|nr:30S ribosomal protein S6 [Dehalococcoidia bacterium]